MYFLRINKRFPKDGYFLHDSQSTCPLQSPGRKRIRTVPSAAVQQDDLVLPLRRDCSMLIEGTDRPRNMARLDCRHATGMGKRSQTHKNEYMRERLGLAAAHTLLSKMTEQVQQTGSNLWI